MLFVLSLVSFVEGDVSDVLEHVVVGTCARWLKRVTFRAMNHSGILGLKTVVFRECSGLMPLREDDPRGRPRALDGGRANDSVVTGLAESDDISSLDSRSPVSSGSSGGGVLPEAEAIINGLSVIRTVLDVEVGRSSECLGREICRHRVP
jgi:hypothetical protein